MDDEHISSDENVEIVTDTSGEFIDDEHPSTSNNRNF